MHVIVHIMQIADGNIQSSKSLQYLTIIIKNNCSSFYCNVSKMIFLDEKAAQINISPEKNHNMNTKTTVKIK